MRHVMAVVTELGLPADVEHIRSVRDIAEHGVLPTPVLTIGGKIKTKGRVLSTTEIKELLRQEGVL